MLFESKKIVTPKDPYDVKAWEKFYQQNPNWRRSVGAEGDNGGDGGDGGSGNNNNNNGGDGGSGNEDVTGLKRANSALKEEKRILQEKTTTLSNDIDALRQTIENLGGDEGIKQLTEFRKQIESDEMAKLLAEGKTEEWLEKRTEKMRKTYEAQISKHDEVVAKERERADKAVAQMQRRELDVEVREACRKSDGFNSAAIPDVVLRAGTVFEFDTEHGLVTKDSDGAIIFGGDAKTPKGISEWLEEQRETAGHWWGKSQSAGAKGSGPGQRGDEKSIQEQFRDGDIDYQQYKEKRKELGYKNF